MSRVKIPEWLFVVVPGLAMAGFSVFLAAQGELTTSVPRFLVVFGSMFLVYTVAVTATLRLKTGGGRLLGYVVLVAVFCRGVLLFAPPSLSTDIYRYLWEGRVIAAGHNPFSLAPADPELEFLRDDNHARINHPHLETIYPPFAQAVFFVGAYLKPDVVTQKIIFTLFDLATLGLVILLLGMRNMNPLASVIYAWSPLVLVEFSLSGHLDSIGIFFLFLAACLWESRSRLSSVLALALSFLSKYLSVLLLPFYAFKRPTAVGVFFVVAAAAYLPFLDASDGLISSLRVYGDNWEFNSAVFSLIGTAFGEAGWVRYVLYGVVALFALFQGYRQDDLLRCSYLVVACGLLLTPTLYPWYLCWVVPFLCFYPNRAWLYLTGAAGASYWVWVEYNATGNWDPGGMVLLLEYAPFFVLLAWSAYRALKTRGSVAV